MYKLPAIPYDYSALEPHISADIMELHHSKHHQGYVDKLNILMDRLPNEFRNLSIEELIGKYSEVSNDIQSSLANMGGGHLNHSYFWRWMTPGGSDIQELTEALVEMKYGTFSKFKDKFTAAAVGLFGSGWVWLMPDGRIVTTNNQDNPLMRGEEMPILGLDVWEHAYYIDYYNKRDEYISAWWNVVNWDEVERLLKNHK